MNKEAGAYIEVDGVITPDPDDEAMSARHALQIAEQNPPKKEKISKNTAPVAGEVTNADK